MARIVYQGDVNIEHGGVFFKVDRKDWDEYGFASAVRVTPCGDAGAQDNAFWIEELTILKPEGDKLKSCMNCAGLSMAEDGSIARNGSRIVQPGTNEYRLMIMDAALSYGYADIQHSITVQIGKAADDFHDGEIVQPDTVLRSNASLERYVRREFVRSL